jgi:hypothetical protein
MAIKIKNQSYASRCEVCHQADMFDFETGNCLRCKDLAIIQEKSTVSNTHPAPKKINSVLTLVFNIATLVGSLVFVFLLDGSNQVKALLFLTMPPVLIFCVLIVIIVAIVNRKKT